ncbi:hypothetical protein [Pseudomonas synxantha]|uniref:Beta-fimbriae major subunit n=1 Tax=Pseudomonas synxantha TaxID=47883 RepID=A0A5D3G573_9PSED|nr:hypothetical protein [Pseudomonas synxantha]TYK54755.1 hypothetical protein FXO26_26035 [Pseudomonas synxantha]
MKPILLISALTVAMGSSFAASAADVNGDKGQSSKILNVTGAIGAPTCRFDMNGGQAVVFDKIAPSQLSMHQVTAGDISSSAGEFSVECDAKTLVRMQLKDTYAGELRKDSKYKVLFSGVHGIEAQFGLVDKNRPDTLIGSYIIMPTKITATDDDNKPVSHGLHLQGGNAIPVFYSANPSNDQLYTLVIGNSNGHPSKTINIEFNIKPNFLPKTNWFTEGNDVEIVGETTFSMVYL